MDLGKTDQLWTQIRQGLLIGSFEEFAAGASAEEACIVKRHGITHDLLESEVSEDGHQGLEEVDVTDLLGAKLVAGTAVDNVNQMQLDHAVYINAEFLVLLDCGWGLTLRHSCQNLLCEEGSSCGKCSLNVVWIEEVCDGSCTALGAKQTLCVAKIHEEVMRGLTLGDHRSLLKEQAR